MSLLKDLYSIFVLGYLKRDGLKDANSNAGFNIRSYWTTLELTVRLRSFWPRSAIVTSGPRCW